MKPVQNPLNINCAYYQQNAAEFTRRTSALAMDIFHDAFLLWIPPGGKILDAGCGPGRDALAFAARGFHVTAIDASPAMVEAASARGVHAQILAFQEIRFDSDFDGIWACASLLHVPHSEMRDVLGRFATALKPQGALYASLKEGRGEGIADDGRFFSYFTLDEFVRELQATGRFEVLNAWTSQNPESSGSIRVWLNYLARRIV